MLGRHDGITLHVLPATPTPSSTRFWGGTAGRSCFPTRPHRQCCCSERRRSNKSGKRAKRERATVMPRDTCSLGFSALLSLGPLRLPLSSVSPSRHLTPFFFRVARSSSGSAPPPPPSPPPNLVYVPASQVLSIISLFGTPPPTYADNIDAQGPASAPASRHLEEKETTHRINLQKKQTYGELVQGGKRAVNGTKN